MKNTLDKHVVAYQGDSPYDFDNEILDIHGNIYIYIYIQWQCSVLS